MSCAYLKFHNVSQIIIILSLDFFLDHFNNLGKNVWFMLLLQKLVINYNFFSDSLDSSNEESYLHPSLLKSAKQPETVGSLVFLLLQNFNKYFKIIHGF